MLKHVTVGIIIDDHEPEKCGSQCIYIQRGQITSKLWWEFYGCSLFFEGLTDGKRCKQCLEEAK